MSKSTEIIGSSATPENPNYRHFAQPRIHGTRVTLSIDDDNDLYRHFCDLAKGTSESSDIDFSQVFGDDFLPADDDKYVVTISKSDYNGWVREDDHSRTQLHDFTMTLRRRNEEDEDQFQSPIVSLSVSVEPQIENMELENGTAHSLPYGTGTRLAVQTTYPRTGDDVINRAVSLVNEILPTKDLSRSSIKTHSLRITKLEAYLRISNERIGVLTEALQRTDELLLFDGSDTDEPRNAKAQVKTSHFETLGFSKTPHRDELKLYRMSDWQSRDEDDPLRDSKLEASIGATASGERSPHLSEWEELVNHLRALVCSHCEWAGIDDSDLVEDQYFSPEESEFEWEHPEGRREQLRGQYDDQEFYLWNACSADEPAIKYDILSVVAENEGVPYSKLAAETGTTKSNIEYHVGNLRDKGILKTPGNPAEVGFTSDYLRELAMEVVRKVGSERFEEDTLGDRRDGREKRATDDGSNTTGSETRENEADRQQNSKISSYSSTPHSSSPTATEERKSEGASGKSWPDLSSWIRQIIVFVTQFISSSRVD